MSKLKCRIILETWYQEQPNQNDIEILPQVFKSIDDALEFLSFNYESILYEFPVVGLKIQYVNE